MLKKNIVKIYLIYGQHQNLVFLTSEYVIFTNGLRFGVSLTSNFKLLLR